ncbi:MAG: class I SAM-dependent methyltransferase [Chloroflexi bacterium]|jgi:SAM-dependent methyltransferase|nr:class I SAM-dependent methyltransferase [Chloroflexota bacterium]MBT5628468.1 class I SAM-dependent methyltransferase [Chloroflexota bacterium]
MPQGIIKTMNIWKYYGVTHADHLVMNPTSEAKTDEFISLLPLKNTPNARVLDIASGKGEQLLRIIEKYDATGVGIDISPYEVEASTKRAAERGLQNKVEFIEGDGAKQDFEPSSFDLAMCLGASWVWGGHLGTIEALKKLVKPGGLMVLGEPYKLKEPEPGYIEAEPDFAPSMVTHAENVEIAQNAGLKLLYAIASDHNDWDRYEGLRLRAAELFAEENPDDPDAIEILEKQRGEHDTYLKHGRDTVGWAIYMFRAP